MLIHDMNLCLRVVDNEGVVGKPVLEPLPKLLAKIPQTIAVLALPLWLRVVVH